MKPAILIFCMLQSADILTTLTGFQILPGTCHEANPAIRALMASVGILPALVIAKTAIAGPMLAILAKRSRALMLAANAMFAAVVAWNIMILVKG